MSRIRKQAQQILFILLGIFISTSVAISNFLIGGLVLCWILEGNFVKKITQIKESKWILSIFGLIGLYALGLYWGDNHLNAEWQFQRLALLLVFPIFITTEFKKKTINRAVVAFLGTAFVSALAALAINNKIISNLGEYLPFINSTYNTAAFIQYNFHNVILALAFSLCLYILIEKKSKYRYLLLLCLFIYALSIFTEGGRAGQVIFNLSALFYIFYYNRNNILRLCALLLLLFSFQFIVYQSTNVYKSRLDALSNIIQNNGGVRLTQDKAKKIIENGEINGKKLSDQQKRYFEWIAEGGSALDIRYVFVRESLDRIIKNPILGYGTGSFGTIFNNEVKSGHSFYTNTTPHNQYLYVWFELGIMGLLLLLSIFVYQIRELFKKKDGIHRVLLPLSFMFLMLIDSYFFIFTLTVCYIFLFTIYTKYQQE